MVSDKASPATIRMGGISITEVLYEKGKNVPMCARKACRQV